jgi:hypothetical protein
MDLTKLKEILPEYAISDCSEYDTVKTYKMVDRLLTKKFPKCIVLLKKNDRTQIFFNSLAKYISDTCDTLLYHNENWLEIKLDTTKQSILEFISGEEYVFV